MNTKLISFWIIIALGCTATSFNINATELELEKKKDIQKENKPFHKPEYVKLPPEFANVSFSSIKDTMRMKEKCINVSGNAVAYEEAIQRGQTIQKFNEYITNLGNFSQLQNDIQTATSTDGLDFVFNKYCQKQDTAIAYVTSYTKTIDPCLEPQERKTSNTMIDVYMSSVNFVCHENGNKIVTFISEKGPKCFEDIFQCIHLNFEIPVFAKTLPTNDEEKECRDMYELQKCLDHLLKSSSCSQSLPVLLGDHILQIVRHQTLCVKMRTAEEPTVAESSSSIFYLALATFIVVLLAIGGMVFLRCRQKNHHYNSLASHKVNTEVSEILIP